MERGKRSICYLRQYNEGWGDDWLEVKYLNGHDHNGEWYEIYLLSAAVQWGLGRWLARGQIPERARSQWREVRDLSVICGSRLEWGLVWWQARYQIPERAWSKQREVSDLSVICGSTMRAGGLTGWRSNTWTGTITTEKGKRSFCYLWQYKEGWCGDWLVSEYLNGHYHNGER